MPDYELYQKSCVVVYAIRQNISIPFAASFIQISYSQLFHIFNSILKIESRLSFFQENHKYSSKFYQDIIK